MELDGRMPYDADEVVRSESGRGQTFADVVGDRLTRRGLLKAGASAGLLLLGGGLLSRASAKVAVSPTGLDFTSIAPSTAENLMVAPNYFAEPLVRWGDPIVAGTRAFDPSKLDAEFQAGAFGYNCDFVGYLPLPYGSQNSDHGLLGVNNEYVNPELMFPLTKPTEVSKEQVDVFLEAMGFSIVEVRRSERGWALVSDSKFNRRVTTTTPMRVSGPAAGDDRMKNPEHPTGQTATGTMSNCAAGKTPWGTVLSGEENFQSMFGNAKAFTDAAEKRSAKRYGLGDEESEYAWEKHHARFDCAKVPHEANHFGWVVEIDPYDPESVPVKRTSLGRFRHEAATTYVTKNSRLVMYSGDDARFEYVYKFVATRPYNAQDRAANRDILDDGVLYVAKFNDDGSGEWMPLVYGQGPLTAENGFRNQADVVIDARIAGDLLGATKMDRPEDIEVNPVNQRVYVVCTNNVDRGREGRDAPDKANPRANNRHGHIIEVIEEGDDHAATRFRWEMFLVCGNPDDASTYFAGFPKENLSPISCPDNICFDAKGNLWVATDGMERSLNLRDGFFAVPTEGPERGKVKQLFATVIGSEICGPEFTPDGTTAFLAIQHPGEGSTFEKPSTRWPDGTGVPRPTVIAIRAKNGAVIGSPGA